MDSYQRKMAAYMREEDEKQRLEDELFEKSLKEDLEMEEHERIWLELEERERLERKAEEVRLMEELYQARLNLDYDDE